MYLLALFHQKTAKNYQIFLEKRFERLAYWNEYKTKSENENATSKSRYFLSSNFVKVNDSLFQFIQTMMTMLKGIKLEGIIYQKVFLRIIMSS